MLTSMRLQHGISLICVHTCICQYHSCRPHSAAARALAHDFSDCMPPILGWMAGSCVCLDARGGPCSWSSVHTFLLDLMDSRLLPLLLFSMKCLFYWGHRKQYSGYVISNWRCELLLMRMPSRFRVVYPLLHRMTLTRAPPLPTIIIMLLGGNIWS
jgi:hypothetical protein